MSEETIIKIIEDLNSGNPECDFSYYTIGNSVLHGIVWTESTKECIDVYSTGNEFFFLKLKGEIIAAVYVMRGRLSYESLKDVERDIEDLHALTIPKHRGNGYMTKLFNETMIPLFKSFNLKKIECTIKSELPEISQHLLSKAGFKKLGEKYCLNKSEISNKIDPTIIEYNKIDTEIIDDFQNKLLHIYQELFKLNDQLGTYGKDKPDLSLPLTHLREVIQSM